MFALPLEVELLLIRLAQKYVLHSSELRWVCHKPQYASSRNHPSPTEFPGHA